MIKCVDYWHPLGSYELLNDRFKGTIYYLYVKKSPISWSPLNLWLTISLARSTRLKQGKQAKYRVQGLWFEITHKPCAKQHNSLLTTTMNYMYMS